MVERASSRRRDLVGRSGVAVDASGLQAFDPSENVKALNEAANKRQDDLRALQKELTDAQYRHLKEVASLNAEHLKEIGKLREDYQERVGKAEAGRLDSIRQVDREEVAKTAVSANTAITTLAKQTTDLATTLQKQVADTATAAEARNNAQYTDVNKRLSALELSSSESAGKRTVADPQLERLNALVATLASTQERGTGKREGIDTTWAAIAVVVTIAISVFATYIATRSETAVSPQVIYAPAPAVAQPKTVP